MFWAGFGEDIWTGLIPLNGDPTAPNNGVSARVIYQLYMDELPGLMEDGDIFMHDNAPVHKAKIIQDLLRQIGVEVMDWRPYSPNLNSMENLWSLLKREIYRLHPHLLHAPNTTNTKQRLIAAAREAWLNLRDDILIRLSETMPDRIQAVLKANGWYTEYQLVILYCISPAEFGFMHGPLLEGVRILLQLHCSL